MIKKQKGWFQIWSPLPALGWRSQQIPAGAEPRLSPAGATGWIASFLLYGLFRQPRSAVSLTCKIPNTPKLVSCCIPVSSVKAHDWLFHQTFYRPFFSQSIDRYISFQTIELYMCICTHVLYVCMCKHTHRDTLVTLNLSLCQTCGGWRENNVLKVATERKFAQSWRGVAVETISRLGKPKPTDARGGSVTVATCCLTTDHPMDAPVSDRAAPTLSALQCEGRLVHLPAS